MFGERVAGHELIEQLAQRQDEAERLIFVDDLVRLVDLSERRLLKPDVLEGFDHDRPSLITRKWRRRGMPPIRSQPGFNFFEVVNEVAINFGFDVVSKIGEVRVAIVQISLNACDVLPGARLKLGPRGVNRVSLERSHPVFCSPDGCNPHRRGALPAAGAGTTIVVASQFDLPLCPGWSSRLVLGRLRRGCQSPRHFHRIAAAAALVPFAAIGRRSDVPARVRAASTDGRIATCKANFRWKSRFIW